jgi:hypothetical protein
VRDVVEGAAVNTLLVRAVLRQLDEGARRLSAFRQDGHDRRMRAFPCGCVLREGEGHFCGRNGRAVSLPRSLCSHERWDAARACCASCGLTKEQLLRRVV